MVYLVQWLTAMFEIDSSSGVCTCMQKSSGTISSKPQLCRTNTFHVCTDPPSVPPATVVIVLRCSYINKSLVDNSVVITAGG
jgi:hypothetical protein